MNYRRLLIRIITFLGGIYYFLYFILPERIGGTPDPSDPTKLVGGLCLRDYQDEVANGFIIIGSMALGLGLINILMVHGSRVAFLRKGWSVSVSLLVGFFLMVGVTYVDWSSTSRIAKVSEELAILKLFATRIATDHKQNSPGVPSLAVRLGKLEEAANSHLSRLQGELANIDSAMSTESDPITKRIFEKTRAEENSLINRAHEQLEQMRNGAHDESQLELASGLGETMALIGAIHRQLLTTTYERSRPRQVYNFFFDGLYVALGAAMFSLLAFYIAAAAYRAFRVKSVESVLMIVAAMLVMLGQIPFGLWLWEDFPELRQWLLQVPNAAASRAIEMGASIAGLIMAFRMWLTIEAESFK